jgi:SAM-dependent methyltransferase
MSEDPMVNFKEAQRQGWKHFAPLEALTTPAAARLVAFAKVRAGQDILDVGCGTGVVAITAARAGARVRGLDLTPELLVRARESAQTAGVEAEFREGDAEALPFGDAAFDVVLSQFGHMFAPRPEVAVAEMLRVLKPGGTLAFATWPPELLMGKSFRLVASYMPPPPAGVSPPPQWGDVGIVRERLTAAVRDVVFDRANILVPALSVPHYRAHLEHAAGPVIKLVELLAATDRARLGQFRAEYDALVAPYFEHNVVRQDYLLTRAVKT